MSLSAMLFGEDSFIHKITNIMGLGIPGLLHKWAMPDSETEPTRLGEISQQTAKEAIPRPIVWGRVRPIGGNIIHCQAPIKRLVMSYVESGGKGGGKKKEKTYREHVYRTYAIGVCEGPITAFSRIWRNNKLVYDGRPGSEWGADNNDVFLKSFRLYLGTWSQMPDPTLESIWGVGQVPAYRGTAYIVAVDEDLTEQAGMVPQWLFEVERAEGTYLTSRPYAIEAIESIDLGPAGQLKDKFTPTDSMQVSALGITGGELRSPLITYNDFPELLDISQLVITDGELRKTLIEYSDGEPDSIDIGQLSIQSGELRNGLITYEEWPLESLDIGQIQITEGVLE